MPATSAITLRTLFERQYAPRRLRGKTQKNHDGYLIQLRIFARFLNHEPTTNDLTDDQVSEFIGWIVSRGRSPATANKARNHILALWRFAARKGIVGKWPDVPAEREPDRVPLAWSHAELTRLFAACRKRTGFVGQIVAGHWWIALHCVAWDTGERIGAMLKLRWSHVDLSSGWLIIPAELRKGKRQDKAFRLHAQTVEALRAIRKPAAALIFPWERGCIYQAYKRLLASAGLPTDRRSKFHRMRRSVASHFEAVGGNATELLGHAARITTKVYLDPRIVGEQQATDVLFRP